MAMETPTALVMASALPGAKLKAMGRAMTARKSAQQPSEAASG
jgi:hypothetical protein